MMSHNSALVMVRQKRISFASQTSVSKSSHVCEILYIATVDRIFNIKLHLYGSFTFCGIKCKVCSCLFLLVVSWTFSNLFTI
jgi:hypothetical protein